MGGIVCGMIELNRFPYHRFTKPRPSIAFVVDGPLKSFAKPKWRKRHAGRILETMSKRMTKTAANELLRRVCKQDGRHQWNEGGRADTEMFACKAGVGPVATG